MCHVRLRSFLCSLGSKKLTSQTGMCLISGLRNACTMYNLCSTVTHHMPCCGETMSRQGPWWKPNSYASIAWLGLFLPALACYLHFLSVHLNTYPEVQGSSIERYGLALNEIIPAGAKVRCVAVRCGAAVQISDEGFSKPMCTQGSSVAHEFGPRLCESCSDDVSRRVFVCASHQEKRASAMYKSWVVVR